MFPVCTEPPVHAAEMMTAELVTLGPDDSVADARRLFDEHGFHHLLVVERKRLVGILSDRDLLRNLSPFVDKMAERPQDVALLNRRVHQIMAREPITLPHTGRIDEAAALMHFHGVSCLPIVDDDERPIGILTRTDLLRGLAMCLLPASTSPSTPSPTSTPSQDAA